jgi:hypothetical protein
VFEEVEHERAEFCLVADGGVRSPGPVVSAVDPSRRRVKR